MEAERPTVALQFRLPCAISDLCRIFVRRAVVPHAEDAQEEAAAAVIAAEGVSDSLAGHGECF